jgi:RND family efflux transporter MFP subunit
MKFDGKIRVATLILAVLVAGILLGGVVVWQFAGHKVEAVSRQAASASQMSDGSMPGMKMPDKAAEKSTKPAEGKKQPMAGMNMQGASAKKSSGSSSADSQQMAGMNMQEMQKMPAGSVMLDTATQQKFNVTYTKVRRARMVRTIQTVGLLHADEETIARVHVKVAGWIQKVFLSYVGQQIKKGQPLFTLYSPDLVSTEQEYLIALKGQKYLSKTPYTDVSSEANSLLAATRDRLRLWDVSDAQIEHLAATGKVKRTMTMYSPISGFVMTRNAYEQTYVSPQTDLYEIANLSKIWVYADIFEYEAPYVHVGQPAQMQLSYSPGKTYYGRVKYVYPTVDPKTRTIKVRLEFPNPGYELKPNMYANVKLKVNYGVQTLVPSESVLNSGNRQVVFVVKPDGYFEPREIKIGDQFDGEVQVLAGLKPGEKVVKSGNFLIDSESRLGAAMQQMMASMPGMKMSKPK